MNRLDALQPSILSLSLNQQTTLIESIRLSRNSFVYKPKTSKAAKDKKVAKASTALSNLSPAELEQLKSMFVME